MKSLLSVAMMFFAVTVAHGGASVSPWVPIFQGIDEASGTNDASYAGRLSVHALRVDLLNPDIRLLVTPPVTNNYVADQRETLLQTPREFLSEFGLQVAINSGYFSPGGYGIPSGTPATIEGLTISKGRLVSAQTSSNLSLSSLLFTTNNQAIFLPNNWPATNTAGIYNGVSGLYPLIISGTNIAYRYTNAFSDSIHQDQPRTAFGLSQDNRYLILMTIDGRQPPYSDGSLDYETADLLILFGAWNGMNVDGGGSTCMVKANECGVPVDINHNYYQVVIGAGTQRPVGCNLGVSALPLPSPMRNVTVVPGTTTAIITWETETAATTQVQYGPTPAYGNSTPFDEVPRKFHVATLTGLTAGTTYYYLAASSTGSQEYSLGCSFTTTNVVSRETLIPLTSSWKYSTNNLDSTPTWKQRVYDETGWTGPGAAALHIESSGGAFPPRNTLLPPGFISPIFRTYYFRTHFNFSGVTSGLTLTFSNYIDDGAIIYLNGAEMGRVRMPEGSVNNATFASFPVSCPPVNDAICPDVFTVGSNINLIQGDNVIAAEVHNYTSGADLLFASALIANRPGTALPRLYIASEGGTIALYWNGEGFTLQRSSDLSSTNNWFDASGPAAQSPYYTPNNGTNGPGTAFFRLRN